MALLNILPTFPGTIALSEQYAMTELPSEFSCQTLANINQTLLAIQASQKNQSTWTSFLTFMKNAFQSIYKVFVDIIKKTSQEPNSAAQGLNLSENVENILGEQSITKDAILFQTFNSKPSPLIAVMEDATLCWT